MAAFRGPHESETQNWVTPLAILPIFSLIYFMFYLKAHVVYIWTLVQYFSCRVSPKHQTGYDMSYFIEKKKNKAN